MLVIPKEHTENILTASPEILVHVKKGYCRKSWKKLGIAEKGFRIVVNTGGRMTVPHLHIHILGGKELGWPPC